MPIFDPRIFDSGVFDTGGTVTPVDRTITIDASLPQLGGSVQVVQGQGTTIAGALPGMSGVVNVLYVSGAARPIVGVAEQRWQQALRMEDGIAARWQDSERTNAGATDRYTEAETLQAGVSTGWQDSVRLPTANEIRYQRGIRVPSASATGRWQQGIPLPVDRTVRFQDGIKTPGRELGFRFQQGIGMRHSKASRFQQAIPLEARQINDQFDNSIRTALLLASRYQDAIGLLAGISEHPVHPPEPPDPDNPPAEVIVPVRRIYTVINTATLKRVDDDTPIPITGMALSIDADSWTWGFTAAAPGSALAYLEPVDGVPVELEARINGVAYRVIVEGLTRSRSFGKSELQVSGRGKAAVLDAPYAPVMNFGNGIDMTVQQLANSVLTVGGVSMGWDIDTDWKPEDWLLPAGTFAHQGTYITALNEIAAGAGAYLQPHATAMAIKVLKRYPFLPRDWSTVTPDFELPAAVVNVEGIQWSDKAIYNRVFVRGMKTPKLVQATTTGTAGDLEAPMLTHQLITDVVGARQMAVPVLSDVGRQALVSLRLPLLAETGFIQPGNFVRYLDGPTTRIGLVRSSAAEVARADKKLTIWQTIGVETHVNV